jgi:hypothetical protein
VREASFRVEIRGFHYVMRQKPSSLMIKSMYLGLVVRIYYGDVMELNAVP